MRKILSDQVGAVSIWLEVLLYGIYCTLFAQASYIASKRKASTPPAKVFLYVTIAIWILSTSHLGLNLYRLLRAYVWLWVTVGPAKYFLDRGRWENFAHDIISMLTTWLANFLLVYRCFLVWNNSFYVVALPTILLFLNIAVTIVALYLSIKGPHRALSESPLVHLVDLTYALAFLQITITTGLIAYRIWSQEFSSKVIRIPSMRRQYPRLMSIVLIAVESAVFYVLVSFLAVILYATKSEAQFLLREAVIPSAGIALVPLTIRSVVRAEGSCPATRNGPVPPTPNHNGLEFETITAGGAKPNDPPIQLKDISRVSNIGDNVSEIKLASGHTA